MAYCNAGWHQGVNVVSWCSLCHQ